ncbi:hypothetical protein [Chryseobacterium sp. 2987]|uniref:hypothetical protein n=1 Tax=Chryseobacterium sp. 2987 TaxID=2817767 RepID=UPI0028635CB1|nr:hypothetical protein [Chryseobacterium sp. 2987]MDR6923371.1 hypothetical protein [Chryseobacterium sp. 2987]
MKKYLQIQNKHHGIKRLKGAVFFFMISTNLCGQQSLGSNNNLDKIIPSTPETYSIFKAGDFPVDYRTGKLNISIPIYSINTSGLSIPIHLTYNTGGIKVDETSGTVGLGWTLAIPNSISVEQHGRSDVMNYTKWFPANPFDHVYTDINLESLPVDVRTKLYNLYDGLQDMQPDIFHYNLPTISGSFIMDSNGGFHTIPYDNIKISYSDTDKRFQITDPKGIIYTLGRGNTLSSTTGPSVDSSVSSFFLENIKLPTNEEISFKYEKRMTYQTTTHSYQDVYAPIEGYEISCRGAVEDTHATTINQYRDILLTEIKYGNETVKFNYKNTIDGVLGRKDVNGANPENTFAIDQILINNSAGNTIGNYKFNHTYFGSGIGTDYRNYRLKLTRIDNILENSKHIFEYNEAYKPAIESFAQDIWGYYNGNDTNRGLIPNLRYFNINYIKGGDRGVYSDYSQAFILKKVLYPTGGSSSFTYENNTIWDKLVIPQRQAVEYGTINNYYDNTQNEYDIITKITPSNEYFYFDVDPSSNSEELWCEFRNSCSNEIPNQIPENGSSSGFAYLDELINNQWKTVATFSGQDGEAQLTDPNFFLHPQAPKRIRTVRNGNCSVALRFYKVKNIKNNNQNNPVGGVRIKSVEDFDGSITYTKRQFEYYNPNLSGKRSSAYFASPLEFVKGTYKVIRNTGYDHDILCNPYVLSADQAINSSLSGKDVVNYEYVTEHTLGKGKKLFKYSYTDNPMDITSLDGNGFNPYKLSNTSLLSETIYSLNANNPLREVIYSYTPTYFKNALSSNYSSGNGGQVIPSTIMGIYLMWKGGPTIQTAWYTTKILAHYPIESGKFLLDEVTTKDYINGKILTSKVNNEYSINDIQKPINLLKQINILTHNEPIETIYSYAHEKGNQLMIEKNMIGIPLETTVKQTINGMTKTLSKTETIYPSSLPHAVAGNLVLPLSLQSYDIQNPSAAHTEVTYDRYDSKGNILQYTTKDGISTAIIWGYNSTQPIAKIEGIKYTDIPSSLVTGIITASDNDNIPPQGVSAEQAELNLLAALDSFRNHASLTGYQITTYSYDPLIGVKSITPPSGIREVYLYDAANRLKEVREHSPGGRIIKEYQYHYKN